MDYIVGTYQEIFAFILSIIYIYLALVVILGIVLPIVLHNQAKEKGEISVGCAYLLLFCWGGVGAHRFYVNKTGSAVLWIFTGGFFGIGYIVDLFLIPSMVTDRNNQLLMYQNMRQPQQPVNVYVQSPNGQVSNQPAYQQPVQEIQAQPINQLAQAPVRQAIPPVASSRVQSRRPYLIGISGEYTGLDMMIDEHGIILGRDPNTAHLIINKDDCSRRHCVVSCKGENIYLIDYSTNGTFLGSGRRLVNGIMTQLANQQRFYLVDRQDEFMVELR